MLTRRQFIAATAAGIAGAPYTITLAGERENVALPREQAHYGFVLLGDLHFDKYEHHDMEWVRKEKPNDIRQIDGYVASTRDHMPRLFEKIRGIIAKAPAPIAGIIQIGDFVEGLCGSYALQSLQNRDAIAFVESSKLGKPFLMTKGNHDITGPDADRAFDDVLLPWMAKQSGTSLSSANYTWTHGKDLYVFFDAYRPDMDWLNRVASEAEQAAHVFFVLHPPVVPYNARSSWHIFSRESQQEQRKALLSWLGKYKAIVLSGHLHRYAHLTRKTEAGVFHQLALSSVVRSEQTRVENERSGLDAYSEELLELEPKFSPDSREERAMWLKLEKPSITSYDYAKFPGYATLWIYDDVVQADIYPGTSQTLFKSRFL